MCIYLHLLAWKLKRDVWSIPTNFTHMFVMMLCNVLPEVAYWKIRVSHPQKKVVTKKMIKGMDYSFYSTLFLPWSLLLLTSVYSLRFSNRCHMVPWIPILWILGSSLYITHISMTLPIHWLSVMTVGFKNTFISVNIDCVFVSLLPRPK